VIARKAAACYFPRKSKTEDIMIHHLSIAARDPQKAAGVLAELMGGKAVPFPPNPGSYFALQLDDHGSGVEVYPAGTHLEPGGHEGGGFIKEPRISRSASRPMPRKSNRSPSAPAGTASLATAARSM
jgi:hypothetical protein